MSKKHIRVTCPECLATGRAPRTILQKHIRCPRCSEIVRYVQASKAPTAVYPAILSYPPAPPLHQRRSAGRLLVSA